VPKKKKKPTKKKSTTKKPTKKKAVKKIPTKKKVAKKKAVKQIPTKKKVAKKKAVKRKVTKKRAEETEVLTVEIEVEEEEIEPTGKLERVIRLEIKHGFIPIPKVWPDHITKYERSRIIGARALQISMGAPILVEELEKIGNPVKVAEKELDFGILPLTIRRIFPDGEILDLTLQELLEND